MASFEHIAFTGTGSAYDPETGEALVYGRAGTHKVVNIAQAASYHERGRQKGRQADFTFTAIKSVGDVISVLTTAQCGYLTLLQCYVGYDGGLLVNADDTPMKTADMIDALQLNRKKRTFYDFLTACVTHGIILADSQGHRINPKYHFRGMTHNRAVIRSYTAKVKQLYREVRAVDLGLMYRMLAYVHYETNALCANPLERDPSKIRWFNGSELAEAIGIDSKELSKRLPRMKFGNEYVVARIKHGGTTSYMFNHKVFYRNSREPDATLVAMFAVSPK